MDWLRGDQTDGRAPSKMTAHQSRWQSKGYQHQDPLTGGRRLLSHEPDVTHDVLQIIRLLLTENNLFIMRHGHHMEDRSHYITRSIFTVSAQGVILGLKYKTSKTIVFTVDLHHLWINIYFHISSFVKLTNIKEKSSFTVMLNKKHIALLILSKGLQWDNKCHSNICKRIYFILWACQQYVNIQFFHLIGSYMSCHKISGEITRLPLKFKVNNMQNFYLELLVYIEYVSIQSCKIHIWIQKWNIAPFPLPDELAANITENNCSKRSNEVLLCEIYNIYIKMNKLTATQSIQTKFHLDFGYGYLLFENSLRRYWNIFKTDFGISE